MIIIIISRIKSGDAKPLLVVCCSFTNALKLIIVYSQSFVKIFNDWLQGVCCFGTHRDFIWRNIDDRLFIYEYHRLFLSSCNCQCIASQWIDLKKIVFKRILKFSKYLEKYKYLEKRKYNTNIYIYI